MKLLAFAFATVAWASTTAALAADADTPLQVKLTASKVVAETNGVERLLPADTVRPGDIIEYQAEYQNRGADPARNVRATLPVPAGGLEYLPDGARPRAVRASLDGKRFDAIPLQRRVTLANGKQELRPIPLSEYRFLRWDLGVIAPGQSATVSSRMRLVSVSGRQGAQP